MSRSGRPSADMRRLKARERVLVERIRATKKELLEIALTKEYGPRYN